MKFPGVWKLLAKSELDKSVQQQEETQNFRCDECEGGFAACGSLKAHPRFVLCAWVQRMGTEAGV